MHKAPAPGRMTSFLVVWRLIQLAAWTFLLCKALASVHRVIRKLSSIAPGGGADRHFYVIQRVTDGDIIGWTLDGGTSTGWTKGTTTLTIGGVQYEWYKSEYTWRSSVTQGLRLGITRA